MFIDGRHLPGSCQLLVEGRGDSLSQQEIHVSQPGPGVIGTSLNLFPAHLMDPINFSNWTFSLQMLKVDSLV